MREKSEWEKIKAQLNRASRKDTEVVKFNIGGTHFTEVTIATLNHDKKSFLSKMFSSGDNFKPLVQDDGRIFIDRDGEAFMHVIDDLRNGKTMLPEFHGNRDRRNFFKELNYWAIETTHDAPEERY